MSALKNICPECLNLGKVLAPHSPELTLCPECLPDDDLPVPAAAIFRAHGVRLAPIVLRGLVADARARLINVRV